jgi:hypothetical protein
VLKVPIPAFQCEIQIFADSFHTSSIIASSLAPDGVFEFIQALLARPFLSPFKMVAKEVEPSSLVSSYDPCFGQLHLQSVFFYPLVVLFEHLLRFFLATTQHHEVVGVSESPPLRKERPQFGRRIRVRRTWQKPHRTGVTLRLGSGGCCDGDVLGSSACLMMVIWTRAEKEFRSRPLEDGILFLEHPQGPVPERMHPAVVSQVHPVKHAPVYLFG